MVTDHHSDTRLIATLEDRTVEVGFESGMGRWTTMVDSGNLSCHLHGLLCFKEILKKIATRSCDVLQRLCRAIETN